MKKIFYISILLLSILFIPKEANAQYVNANFDYFYSSLRPYGSWIELNDGFVVWRPRVRASYWSPYSVGTWIWTTDGWYWDSYEPFGHIVFHYGRWYFDDYYGWVWVPDNYWAPAWVEWRYDDYYVGWAPLPPYANFSISIGIHFTHNYVIPYRHYHFVHYNHFCVPSVNKYFIVEKEKYRVYSRTQSNVNYVYRDNRIRNVGVDRSFVEKKGGVKIRERNLNFEETDRITGRPVVKSDNEIKVYRQRTYNNNKSTNVDYQIERSTRNSNLDVNEVQIGERNLSKRESTRSIDRQNNENDIKTYPRVSPQDDKNRKTPERKKVVPEEREINKQPTREIKPYFPKENNERKSREIEKPKKNNREERTVQQNNNVKENRTIEKRANDNPSFKNNNTLNSQSIRERKVNDGTRTNVNSTKRDGVSRDRTNKRER
ncbi:MAG: hypothetical protein STSR0008_21470 [Ignavibacterium sp.]